MERQKYQERGSFMELRKIAVGSVMIGALSAAGLGLAGTASATPVWHPKPPVVSHQKTVTVTKTATVSVSNSGQLGNGLTQQTASGNAGAIANPQIGFGTNVGLQVPLNVNAGPAASTGNTVKKGSADSESSADQDAKLRQSATGNDSYNSTSVNNSTDNGNGGSVSIGASN